MPLYQPNDIILNGKYKIEKLLGTGAFGEVYLATHVELNVKRAVKVLHRQMPGAGTSVYTEYLERFRQEAQIGARLPHENLVQVHDFEQAEDSLHLVMEYAVGGSLGDKLQKAQKTGLRITIEDSILIIKDITKGLAVLHENQIVHRDLKPNNILFDKKGHAKVADLGLAQIPGGASMRSRFSSMAEEHPGTPAYMSPEQENSNKVLRPSSDIYALGLMWFEILSGKNYNLLRPGTQLREYLPEAQGEVNVLISKMLDEDPKNRPWNGAELLTGLEKLEQDQHRGKQRQADKQQEQEEQKKKQRKIEEQKSEQKEPEKEQFQQELKETIKQSKPRTEATRIEQPRITPTRKSEPNQSRAEPNNVLLTKPSGIFANRRRNFIITGLLVVEIIWILLASQISGQKVLPSPTIVQSTDTTAKQEPNNSIPKEADSLAAAPFKVALVTPNAITDLAFSQSMHDTLVRIQEEMGADKFQFFVSDGLFVVDDAAAAIRDYASLEYDLILVHGSQYGSVLKEIAQDFPETSFAWGTAGDTFGLPNVFAYQANSQEGGYVSGVLAAALTKSGVIGVVGPVEVGDAKLYVDGFVAGVTATNPDITVKVTYTGSFIDVVSASEAAQTHIGAGADVMSGSAQMVVGAVDVAKEKGVLWFGTQADQSSLAPNIVVACQVYDWSLVVNDMVSMIKASTLGGRSYTLTLKNGGLVMAYNPGFNIPADVKAKGEVASKGIIDGTITIGVGGE